MCQRSMLRVLSLFNASSNDGRGLVLAVNDIENVKDVVVVVEVFEKIRGALSFLGRKFQTIFCV